MEHLASQPPQDILEFEGVCAENNQSKLQSHVSCCFNERAFHHFSV